MGTINTTSDSSNHSSTTIKNNFSSVRDGVDHLSQYQVEQDGNGDWNKYMYFTVVDKDGSVVGLLDTDKCLNDAIGNLEKS